MSDYQPLDMSALCNAGIDVLTENRQIAPVGRSLLRGLPFLIGADSVGPGDKCFIAFDGNSGGMTIPVNEKARRVIIAHRLLESNVLDGSAPGEVVAEPTRPVKGNSKTVALYRACRFGSDLRYHTKHITKGYR